MDKKPLLTTFSLRFAFAASIILAVFFGTEAAAQTPQYYYTATSPVANSFPFNTTTSNRVQWLFTPSDFQATPPSNVYITKIYIQSSSFSSSTSATITNFNLSMGSTTLTALSTGAWNTGLTSCISSSSYSVTINGTSWTVFPLTNRFLYTGGNFLLEMSCSSSSPGFTVQQNGSNAGRRMYGSNTATTGTANTGQLFMGFDTTAAICTGTPATPTITTAALTAANPHCAGTTKTITASSTSGGTGITYQWETSTSSTGPWTSVSGGSGATTLSYTTPAITTNTYYRIAVTCTNSSTTVYSSPYYVMLGAAQPSTISGLSTFCAGDTSTYSVTAVSGTSYTWTLPTGWAGVASGNSIFVTPNSTAGSISVIASSTCGTSISSTKSVTQGSAPMSPGTILGNSAVCPNSSQTYTIVPITGATSYIWTLPAGWSGTSTKNSITLTSGNTGGTISVRAANGCGQSNANSLAVSIISTLATPGAISGPTAVCSGGPYTYKINAIPNALSYAWILPAGWSGTTTDTSIQVFPTSSGTLSVTANTTCVSSASKTLPVTVTATVKPTVTVAAPSSALCQSTAVTFTATATSPGTAPVYQWKRNGLAVTGLGNTYTSNTLSSGDVITVTLKSSASCASPDTVTSQPVTASITPAVTPGVSINTTPPLTICSGTPVTFTTVSNGGGTAPTYQWYKNGNPIAGATGTSYTDASLTNKDTLTIQMTTNAVCATTPSATSNKAGVKVNDIVTPTVSITVSPGDVITAGQPVTFTATQSNGGSTPTYQWKKNGVNIPFETGDVYTSSTVRPGDHIWVEMLSYAPCVDTALVHSNEIVLKSVLGVGSSVAGSWEGVISAYPNPSSGRFTVGATWALSHSGERVSIEVLNVLGQAVYHSEVVPVGASWHADVSLPEGISNGRYVLRVASAGMAATAPVVLSR